MSGEQGRCTCIDLAPIADRNVRIYCHRLYEEANSLRIHVVADVDSIVTEVAVPTALEVRVRCKARSVVASSCGNVVLEILQSLRRGSLLTSPDTTGASNDWCADFILHVSGSSTRDDDDVCSQNLRCWGLGYLVISTNLIVPLPVYCTFVESVRWAVVTRQLRLPMPTWREPWVC